MDREKAKFILQSYRPDGADAGDPHFTEALKLAVEDRELGAWLADERAHDSMFAAAMNSVNIPEGLRDEILSVLENDGSESADVEFDSIFSGALMGVNPPSGLRDQIILAMEVEKRELKIESKKLVRFPIPWKSLSAIAALLMVGAISLFSSFQNENLGGQRAQIALGNVKLESVNLINASREVEFSDSSLGGVNQWLVRKGLPDASTVPTGLIKGDAHTKGGRKLVLDNGIEASMIFFEKKKSEDYYLMVLKADSVKDIENISSLDSIGLRKCLKCPITHFNITSWKDADKVYLLISKQKREAIVELF